MDSLGAEVGHKMRSAIKAKLMELNCYVDDELPDYIMVMVANKRTKSQMNEDLQIFLTTKTETFVDWLHIVLKKLKEVTVTNPEVYKKTSKRKSSETGHSKVKKEKKIKKERSVTLENVQPSLTDDLPLNVNTKSEKRKVVLENNENADKNTKQDNFDIPLLSEVALSNEEDLHVIEKKIKSIKDRLGLVVEDDGDNEDVEALESLVKNLTEKKNASKNKDSSSLVKSEEVNSVEERLNDNVSTDYVDKFKSNTEVLESPERVNESRKSVHERITFQDSTLICKTNKRKSVLERLGKRPSEEEFTTKKQKTAFSEDDIVKQVDCREHLRKKQELRNKNTDNKEKNSEERVFSRLGVQSKVSIPDKNDMRSKSREVPSVIRIKPRSIPLSAQANKNLLLRAVADAQKSVTQTPTVGKPLKSEELFTKKYLQQKEQLKASESKNKLKNLIIEISRQDNIPTCKDNEKEYTPKPIKHLNLNYSPTSKIDRLSEDKSTRQILKDNGNDNVETSKKSKKTPSPIIFNETHAVPKAKSNVPDILPIVRASLLIKNKERCKYWPTCRQGDKCEFIHPASECEAFPSCKFGDKCLFIHPTCKFSNSCTRKDCPFSHTVGIKPTRFVKTAQPTIPTCKFYPHCSKINCSFYHPKPCKFGALCSNRTECGYFHGFKTNNNLTWKSSS